MASIGSYCSSAVATVLFRVGSGRSVIGMSGLDDTEEIAICFHLLLSTNSR